MWLRHTLYRPVAKIKKIFTENGRYLLFDNLLKAGKFTVGQGCPLLVNVVRESIIIHYRPFLQFTVDRYFLAADNHRLGWVLAHFSFTLLFFGYSGKTYYLVGELVRKDAGIDLQVTVMISFNIRNIR